MASREDRLARREARRVRGIARRARVAARRARVAARRDADAAARAVPAGQRRIEYLAPEVGAPPGKVEAVHFSKSTNLDYMEVRPVESSWVGYIMLVRFRTTGLDHLAVRFLDGYTCWYPHTSVTDYLAMKGAPSKGKYVWAHLYGTGKRQFTAAARVDLAAMGLPV